jgi:hypothetical protein
MESSYYYLELPLSFVDYDNSFVSDFYNRIKNIDPKCFKGQRKIVVEYRKFDECEIHYIYYINNVNIVKCYGTCSEEKILTEMNRMVNMGYYAIPVPLF